MAIDRQVPTRLYVTAAEAGALPLDGRRRQLGAREYRRRRSLRDDGRSRTRDPVHPVRGNRRHEVQPADRRLQVDRRGLELGPRERRAHRARRLQDRPPSPRPPGTLYAGTQAGMYKTTDGGASWARSSSGIPKAPSAASPLVSAASRSIRPTRRSCTPPAGGDKVYRSTNAGAAWLPLGSGLPATVGDVAVDPLMPATLYATAEPGHLRAARAASSSPPTVATTGAWLARDAFGGLGGSRRPQPDHAGHGIRGELHDRPPESRQVHERRSDLVRHAGFEVSRPGVRSRERVDGLRGWSRLTRLGCRSRRTTARPGPRSAAGSRQQVTAVVVHPDGALDALRRHQLRPACSGRPTRARPGRG